MRAHGMQVLELGVSACDSSMPEMFELMSLLKPAKALRILALTGVSDSHSLRKLASQAARVGLQAPGLRVYVACPSDDSDGEHGDWDLDTLATELTGLFCGMQIEDYSNDPGRGGAGGDDVEADE
jgi:hypothetical protein